MKKILILSAIVSLVLSGLIGCSESEKTNTKTEEELRAEIRAELEAETEAEQGNTQTEQPNTQAQQPNTQPEKPNTSSNQTPVAHSPSTVYKLKELSVGDRVGPFIVESSRVAGKFEVVFRGELKLVTSISVDEMWGELSFSSNNPDKDAIMIDFGNGVTKNVLAFGLFDNATKVTSDLGGNPNGSVEKTITISGFTIAGRGDSYFETVVMYNGMEGQSTSTSGQGSSDSNTSSAPSNQSALSKFTTESLRGQSVNYGQYSAVVIPQYSEQGANYGKLEQYWYNDGIGDFTLNFAIFGKVEGLSITRVQGDEGLDGSFIGDVENALIVIVPNLPNDISYYVVSGNVVLGDGSLEAFEFGLDDMRDASDYPVYTY